MRSLFIDDRDNAFDYDADDGDDFDDDGDGDGDDDHLISLSFISQISPNDRNICFSEKDQNIFPQVNLRLIIMWSVPFNFNLRDSYYAIGLTHNKVSFRVSAATEGKNEIPYFPGEVPKLCLLVPPDVLWDKPRIQEKSNW